MSLDPRGARDEPIGRLDTWADGFIAGLITGLKASRRARDLTARIAEFGPGGELITPELNEEAFAVIGPLLRGARGCRR